MSTTGLGLVGALGLTSDDYRKAQVWLKGAEIPGYDASVWRRDHLGYAIRYSDYGNRDSDYGWEIDHIVATALGGSDDITNLRPLHWRNNASHGGTLAGLLSR